MFYIGVDLGTSSVKLLLINEEGKVLNMVSREYSLYFPHPGWSEQNPEDWMINVKDGLKALIEGFDASKIKALGVAGQMHGLVILDSKDKVIRPAILWNDGRTQEETDYLNNEIGIKRLSDNTGNIAFAGFTAPKIIWVKNHEKENFARIRKIMLPKDYINYCLTGIHGTDYSDASGMLLLDVENKCWSKDMLDICGISEDLMPRLFESYEIIGEIKEDIAKELGLPEDLKVIAGAGDNAAAAIGTGTSGDGGCNISLGTSGTIFITSKKFLKDKNNSLHAFAHADGGYHLMGCMLSASSCNKWWIEDILKSGYSEEEKNINLKKAGENHIYYLPYLMGERAPHNDPYAKSCFIGMTMDSKREDLTQAVIEGVMFGIRDSFDAAKRLGIKIEKSTICGGGSKSYIAVKTLADVLDIPVIIPKNEQGPGLGVAILAMYASGEYSSIEEAASKCFEIGKIIEPDKDIVEKYNKKYNTFKKLYPALKDIFEEI